MEVKESNNTASTGDNSGITKAQVPSNPELTPVDALLAIRTEREQNQKILEEFKKLSAEQTKMYTQLVMGGTSKAGQEQPKTKTIKEKVWEWTLINDSKAIWLRNKDEIDESEYNKFY